MDGNLGARGPVAGVLTTQNKVTPGTALWVATFRPQDLAVSPAAEVYHGSLRGPGGYFLVYIDEWFYDIGVNGLINAYDPKWPMYIREGQSISFHWSTGTGSAPQVWLYLREPEVGRL